MFRRRAPYDQGTDDSTLPQERNADSNLQYQASGGANFLYHYRACYSPDRVDTM